MAPPRRTGHLDAPCTGTKFTLRPSVGVALRRPIVKRSSSPATWWRFHANVPHDESMSDLHPFDSFIPFFILFVFCSFYVFEKGMHIYVWLRIGLGSICPTPMLLLQIRRSLT